MISGNTIYSSLKQYAIGLDISTRTIGITLMDTTGKLIDISHISFPKTSKKNGLITIYDKATFFKNTIIDYLKNFHISYIFIEEPLKNGPNIGTTILLAKFNGILSHILYENFKVMPEHITVHTARSLFFPEYIVEEKVKNKKTNEIFIKNILRLPDGDKKQVIFNKVAWLDPQIKWEYNKLGQLDIENYDRADSYVVTKAGLLLNGLINEIPKCEKSAL